MYEFKRAYALLNFDLAQMDEKEKQTAFQVLSSLFMKIAFHIARAIRSYFDNFVVRSVHRSSQVLESKHYSFFVLRVCSFRRLG